MEFKRTNIDVETKIDEVIQSDYVGTKLIYISGEYGVGKSELLKYIENTFINKSYLYFNLDRVSLDNPLCLQEVIINFVQRIGKKYRKKKVDQHFLLKLSNFFLKATPNFQVDINSNLNVDFSNILENLINYINNKWKKYTEIIEENNTREIYYINELVEIIIELTNIEEQFYIVIDNFENLNTQVSEFLMRLNKKMNICFIVSSQVLVHNLNNTLAMDLLSQIANKSDVDNQHTLQRFNYEQTKKFVQLNFNELNNNEIDDIAKKLYTLSDGLPLFLSIICSQNTIEIKNNPTNLMSTKMSIYYNKMLKSYTDEKKHLLFLLCICDKNNHPLINDKVIFKEFLRNNSYKKAYYELITNKIIIENKNKIEISAPLLIYFINEINEFEFSKADLITELYELYKREFELDGIIRENHIVLGYDKEIYSSINNLVIKLVLEYKKNMQFERAKKLLVYAIKYGNTEGISRKKIYELYIETCYELSKLDDILKAFENNLNFVNDLEKNTILQVAKAYYYTNKPNESLKLCHEILNGKIDNDYLKAELEILIISSYDLIGDYGNGINFFKKNIAEYKEKGSYIYYIYLMISQMVCNDTNEIYKNLLTCINKFQPLQREYSCTLNNFAIENIMNGNFDNDILKKLEEANTFFIKHYGFESQFTYNNLGLYFQYKKENPNFDVSIKYYKKAEEYAVSALQKCYIHLNLGIIYYDIDKKESYDYFRLAEKYGKQCVDPVVKNYMNYNLALFYYKENKLDQAKGHLSLCTKGLDKDQLSMLNNKRLKLAKKLNMVTSIFDISSLQKSNRRSYFAEQLWEPCELMFYN